MHSIVDAQKIINSEVMMVLASVDDVLKGKFNIGETVRVRGWVRTRRDILCRNPALQRSTLTPDSATSRKKLRPAQSTKRASQYIGTITRTSIPPLAAVFSAKSTGSLGRK